MTMSPVLPTRPQFGTKQIKTPEELTKGLLIRICDSSGYCITATVLDIPYEDERGMHVRVEFQRNSSKWIGTINLADHSIIANSKGLWNQHNWIQFEDQKNAV